MPKSSQKFVKLHPLARTMADNFKRLRLSVGTQEEMGALMGLSQAQVSRLEQGKSLKHISTLGEMIEKAGLDPMDLLRVDGDVSDPTLAEVRRLWKYADDMTRGIILQLLQKEAGMQALQQRVVGSE